MTPLGTCIHCNRPLVSGHTPAGQVPPGHVRHEGKGRCNPCAARARRAAARDNTPPAQPPADPYWAESAACAGTDPEMWFVDAGKYAEQLERICNGCPVKADCLTATLREEGDIDQKSRFGYRAGTTPRQRWLIARGKDAA